LRQIAAQVRNRWRVYHEWGLAERLHRGLGISVLFSGESGTGKTLAAEVLAGELDLDLYRVDLSSVVNKYIGETEKHLKRLFDAFESCGAILFFDECDALFGKRSEVRDSHDRYANIEVNYLLQRLETYRGLAILATNRRSSLDPAFLRRLRFVINFPSPTIDERLRIWKRLCAPGPVAPQIPVGPLDYDRLARLDFTGGHILNVVLCASFRAVNQSTDPCLTMADVLAAARDEHVKLGRPITQADFAEANRSRERVV
jgi:SpoVK/Ycf46/Vps4 family AAA+-type ATPase